MPMLLGSSYGLSELALLLRRRSGTTRFESKDRYSLWLLWIVILTSIFVSVQLTALYPAGTLPHRRLLVAVGILLFALGILLRWWAIIVLGKFFTVDVAIAEEHRVIDTGPYRWMRHPSYTGALVALLGFGLALCNWMSILCLMIPIVAVFFWRIQVEERALFDALGDDYRAYAKRTKRLFPFLL